MKNVEFDNDASENILLYSYINNFCVNLFTFFWNINHKTVHTESVSGKTKLAVFLPSMSLDI